ncbi:AraC family transcriptional regulator [Paracidovorax avenae]|uniref:AraC family transcriptional regulator n=1 Tax=Paracidovorax avenae TaxID=80867 RepID=UPI000D2164EC|nr:helix-turn-helix transcriptional regulator [Paracidovorax avenae]AVT01129.1 AraC family transcriptional regulator [Paracidovorax avenae]AVT08132.1 AraC family transcriptional regulator [Paracidovorax avenae]
MPNSPKPPATAPAGRTAPPLPRAPQRPMVAFVPSLTPHLFVPSAARPMRAKHRQLKAGTQVMPHCHPWAQVAVSTTGVIRLTVAEGTYTVPPSRAVWIPPGVEHAVTVVEDADMRTLYLHQARGRCGPGVARAEEPHWRQCRVLEMSELLRALVCEMPTGSDDAPPLAPEVLRRERLLSALIREELCSASAVRLGVQLPRDKRLRHLCEAVLADPTRHEKLADWARDTGASPRTVARLFRQDLSTTFTQWRQQVLLAQAVALAAGRRPVNQIAAELGYSSPSAFSAMVRRAVGVPPARFLGLQA